MPEAGAHVSVLAYTLVAPDPSDVCLAFNGRTMAVIDVVEAEARETRMVTVAAGETDEGRSRNRRVELVEQVP